MLQFMNEVDSLNRNYASLAGDSLMPIVVKWMDRHGSANERMRAHYLQAAVYRDRGQAPEALAVDSARGIDKGMPSRIFDMQGRSVKERLVKGLYIQNGRKQVVKNTSR
jgi:hypothetical protein